MRLDRFKNSDGDGYRDASGCYHETAQDLLQTGVLGFCGCGDPRANLTLVRDVLVLIERLRLMVWSEKEAYPAWEALEKALLPTPGLMFFTYYVLDLLKLTEHGGSVPGWLTDKGRELLADLNEVLSQPEEES